MIPGALSRVIDVITCWTGRHVSEAPSCASSAGDVVLSVRGSRALPQPPLEAASGALWLSRCPALAQALQPRGR